MHRQIRFSIWFPIVLVVAFAAGYLFWQQALVPGPYDLEPVNIVRNGSGNLPRDEVLRGWQTYRNEKYGFEVKYPKKVELDSSTIDKIVSREEGLNTLSAHFAFHQRDDKNKTSTKMEFFLNKKSFRSSKELIQEDSGVFQSYKNLADNQWAVGTYLDGPGAGSPVYGLIDDDLQFKVYIWDLKTDEPPTQDVIKEYEDILSTFKFIR